MSDSQAQVLWTPMCETIPAHIDWLYASRDSAPESMAFPTTSGPSRFWLNYTISMMTANMVEGALELLLRDKIRTHLNLSVETVIAMDTLPSRLAKECDKQIRSARGWDSLKKQYSVVMGQKISDDIDAALFKAVNLLFLLRNATMGHGRSINAVGGIKEFEWESQNLNNIEDYLRELTLWEDVFSGGPEPAHFFTNAITDHFYESAIKFLIELNGLPTSIGLIITGHTADLVAKIRSEA